MNEEIADLLYEIINERDVDKFDLIYDYMMQLADLTREEEVELRIGSVYSNTPQFIKKMVNTVSDFLERIGYERKIDDINFTKEDIERIIEEKDIRYFADIPDQLRRLGCDDNSILNNLKNNNLYNGRAFVDSTVSLVRKALEDI